MRAGMTNRSSPLVKSFRRIQKPRPIARPHPLPHLQSPTLVLPSGPMANGPAHRKRLQSFLKPSYIEGLWNVPSVSLCVRFPTFCTRKTHQLFSFLISFRLCRYTFTCLIDSCQNPRCNPRCLTNCGTHICLSCSVLSHEHQLLEVLRPGDMHGMLCSNQAIRADDNSFSFRSCGLSLLRTGTLRGGVHPAPLENRDW